MKALGLGRPWVSKYDPAPNQSMCELSNSRRLTGSGSLIAFKISSKFGEIIVPESLGNPK
jgi:hypothetical protein